MAGNERWRISFDHDLSPRAIAAMSAVSNGHFGTRLGGLDDVNGHESVAGGVFDGEAVPDLLPGPVWTALATDQPEGWTDEVTLDLAGGVTERRTSGPEGTLTIRCFASLVRPAIHALEATGPARLLTNQTLLSPPTSSSPTVQINQTPDGGGLVVESSSGAKIRATGRSCRTASTDQDGEPRVTMRRLIALEATADGAAWPPSTSVLDDAEALGFEDLLIEHREAWSNRWDHVAIDLPERPELERAIRFAQYHVLASSHSQGEAAIGPRGLTGHSYRGHVFWDTDIFVVPALAAMAPALALPPLTYRHNRLEAARQLARAHGHQGARFPWESAGTGEDVTPTQGRDLRGQMLDILTGELEIHIVADVAWACQRYVDWTGDEAFRRGPGAEILIETARYWQSRVEHDDDGTGHIRAVIGPDEYHERVDDNVFTNEMARWNLLAASALCRELDLCQSSERQQWQHTASVLVSGFDEQQGRHQQFDGFDQLQPVFPTSIGVPPIPADALLGHERIQETQIVKQADVLMLHFLLPDSMPPGSLAEDLDYYVPRTAHGSSLSPAITASVLARGDRLVDAAHWFEVAATFDLVDVSGTTGGGVHLATMGGLWQALTDGFLGVRPTPVGQEDSAGLSLDPKLPSDWGPLTHRLFFQSNPIRLEVTDDSFLVTSPEPVSIILASNEQRSARRIEGIRRAQGWEFR